MSAALLDFPAPEIAVTFFRDWAATTKREEQLSLSALAKRIDATVAPTKDQLPWLKLARFGAVPKDRKGCLRHNPNVCAITGVEGDYDGEAVTFDDAVRVVAEAGITALVYPSPSYRPDAPRWRVLAPLSRERSPEDRDHLMDRLAGLYHSTLMASFGSESWTLSQSYYYGRVANGASPPAAVVTLGRPIDLADELDAVAVSKPTGNGHSAGDGDPEADIEDIEAALAAIPNPLPKWADKTDTWNEWNKVAMAVWRASGGSEGGFAAFDRWSRKWPDKYDSGETAFRWRHLDRSPPDQIGFGTLAYLAREAQPGWVAPSRQRGRLSLDDFWAYLPQHDYIFAPTRQHWPAASVKARVSSVPMLKSDGTPLIDDDGKPRRTPAPQWLDRNRAVEQMIWAPGEPEVIRDRLLLDGGWMDRRGAACFNLYMPAPTRPGNAELAAPWVEHVRRIYPDESEHLFDWFAHRVQRPAEKVNHAIVLGGDQGIGKDTVLEPLKEAVGRWNFKEASPTQVLSDCNDFLKATVLRISEARDLGEWDRFKFYEHMKAYTAAPPDVLRINEKYLRQYLIPNVCGVAITTNHKLDGFHLDRDDRRHYVAWSNAKKEEFAESYWREFWTYYGSGGLNHVAEWLRQRDISHFDAKKPPPKTEAFWQIVNYNRPGEESELDDVIDDLGDGGERPAAITLSDIRSSTSISQDFAYWLGERKNRRVIPHRLKKCGYEALGNPDAKDGLWKFPDGRQTIYVRTDMPPNERLEAARRRLNAATEKPCGGVR